MRSQRARILISRRLALAPEQPEPLIPVLGLLAVPPELVRARLPVVMSWARAERRRTRRHRISSSTMERGHKAPSRPALRRRREGQHRKGVVRNGSPATSDTPSVEWFGTPRAAEGLGGWKTASLHWRGRRRFLHIEPTQDGSGARRLGMKENGLSPGEDAGLYGGYLSG
jgi:hypothetical protein